MELTKVGWLVLKFSLTLGKVRLARLFLAAGPEHLFVQYNFFTRMESLMIFKNYEIHKRGKWNSDTQMNL